MVKTTSCGFTPSVFGWTLISGLTYLRPAIFRSGSNWSQTSLKGRAWADEAETVLGLRSRPAKMSVELHPPVPVDKGTVVDDLVGDLRLACYVARIVSGNYKQGMTRHALEAATVGGASILRRPDLGRLLPGCKADFSLVDLSHPYMQPPLEPVRSLIFSASDRAVRHVYVDGTQVVRDGKVLTIDVDAAVEAMNDGQRRRIATVPQRDWAGRTADQLAPPVFATRDRLPQSRPVH